MDNKRFGIGGIPFCIAMRLIGFTYWLQRSRYRLCGSGRDLLALDVGAGSGRDAAWLASWGYEVVAAEPAAGMRREASKRRLRLRQDQQVPEWAGLRSIEEPSTRVIPEPSAYRVR